jgi:hypothetical protein
MIYDLPVDNSRAVHPRAYYAAPFSSGSVAIDARYSDESLPESISFNPSMTYAEASDTVPALSREFYLLVPQWKNDTRAVSSLSDMFMHPAYQRIMAMGKPALPLILTELREHSGHWFYALKHIAGKDIATGATNMAAAKAAWLEWGYKNGYQ